MAHCALPPHLHLFPARHPHKGPRALLRKFLPTNFERRADQDLWLSQLLIHKAYGHSPATSGIVVNVTQLYPRGAH